MVERAKKINKKIAKHKKKSWRSIDISDLEQHLEEERLQERTGGLVADKPDQQLFFVDKHVQNLEKEQEHEQSEPPVKRRRREPKPLKCFALLEPDPKIKPARVAHNIRKNSHLKKPGKVLEKLAEGKKTLKEITAEKQRRQARKSLGNRVRSFRSLRRATYDMWQDEKTEDKKLDEHYMKVTRKRRVNVPDHHYNKTSKLPAVQVPHPGASYNPAYDDYQELLREANTVEEKKQKRERRLYNSMDAKYPTAKDAPTKETWLEEMSAGLHDDINEEGEVSQTDDDRIAFNPAVRREDEKTEKQREKEQKAQSEVNQSVEKKLKKKKENEIFRLRNIKSEIRKKEKEIEKNIKKRKQLKDQEPWKTRKLGKLKYEDPDLELKLSDELVGSLRQLKPEGNLLMDRFKSLQKRNVLEPRLRAKRKNRYKKKEFEKKGHKEIVL